MFTSLGVRRITSLNLTYLRLALRQHRRSTTWLLPKSSPPRAPSKRLLESLHYAKLVDTGNSCEKVSIGAINDLAWNSQEPEMAKGHVQPLAESTMITLCTLIETCARMDVAGRDLLQM